MDQPKVTVLMRAYNAERYIEKAIESVLDQTEVSFEFIIRNNGSTDNTGAIINSYASKDARIKCLSNKVNWVLDEGGDSWWCRMNGEYITILDADDFLDKNYLDVMYKSAKQNDADLTVCGTTMFKDESPDNRTLRIPPEIKTTDLKQLEDHFIDLYGVLRTVWGKFYNKDFYFKHYAFAFDSPIQASGLDTYSVLGYLQKCKSFVCVNKSLHYYRIHDNSSSRQQNVELLRIKEAEVLFKRGLQCLKTLGILSQRNKDALYLIHKNHMDDLFALVYKSQRMSGRDKVAYYQEIFKDDLYCSYSINNVVIEDTLKLVMKFVHNIVANDKGLLINAQYLVRLYLCYNELFHTGINVLTLPRLLSVICDKENKFKIGTAYLTAD